SVLAEAVFAPEVLARLGLAELKAVAVPCRQTTCRLEYEFPSRLVRTVEAAGLPPISPLVLVEEAVGWPAPRGGGFHQQTFERDGEAYTRASVILGFDEPSWDP